MSLEAQDFIDALDPRVEPGLSVTYMLTKPRVTYFSYDNWTRVPEPVRDQYTRGEYRTYLVLHECGHALGLHHASGRPGAPVPIMQQASKGLLGTTKNVWPLATEKLLLRR